MKAVVVVGASLAGLRAAEALRHAGFAGALTIVGEESIPPYNRPPLSKAILTGKTSSQELHFPCDETLDAQWLLGRRATRLDVAGRRVHLSDGTALAYDGIVISTGVAARWPDIAGARLKGTHVIRTLDDSLALRSCLGPGKRLIVAGAGFIGCEVAASAAQLGAQVTVIEPASHPMARLLPPDLGDVFTQIHIERGVEFRFGRFVGAVEGFDSVRQVVLDDGSRLDADAVLFGLGAAPCVDWLEGSGLVLENGVVCDEYCLALGGEGRVAAAGDVAAWRNLAHGGRVMRVEHWSNAVDQGAAAARNLLSPSPVPYMPLMSMWSDQYEFKLQALGAPAQADRIEIAHGSLAERKFVAECREGERLLGVIAVNMPARLASYRARLAADIADCAVTP